MEQPKENKMGTMPVNKLLVTMSLPMVISMIVQALYNIVDSIFVSRLSEDALTAVSMAFPMQNLMISVAVGTGVGINAMLSRALGEKKFEAANKTAENGIFIEVLGYVLFLLIGIFVTKPFFLAQAGAGDSIIMSSVGSAMTFGMNKILITFSSTAVAVFGVYFKLNSFVFMPVFGLNNGMVPIVSYNYGAQNKKRLTKTIKLAIMYAVCIMFIGIMLFQFIPDVLLRLFDASDHMLEIGIPALRVISLSFAFAGICIVISSSLQALGHGFLSMMISITRQLIILLPSAYILAKFGGIHAVWWSFNIAEIASLTLSLLFFKHMYNKIIKHLGE